MSRIMKKICKTITQVIGIFVSATVVFAVDLDPNLPGYNQVSGVSGNLKGIGSDTLNNLMALWSEGFNSLYPGVKIEIEGKGSSTAPPALIEGTAQFGPMSREMKLKERDAFEKKFGYSPSRARVAVDALALFVHRDNPIKSITLQQVDAIFSKNRKGGYHKNIKTWGDLGIVGKGWADKPISLYGRNAASGTYGYFKKVALFKGDYKDTVKEQPGSSAVIQGVAADKYGIGYSGVGYKTADVKTVPLSIEEGKEAFDANAKNAYSGDYALARFLYVYVNRNPVSELDPLRAEFLKYILSKQGQLIVIKGGYYPVSERITSTDLKTLGLK